MNELIILKDTENYYNALKRLKSVKSEFAYRLITNNPGRVRSDITDKGHRTIMPAGGPLLEEQEFLPKTKIPILQIQKCPIKDSEFKTYIIILGNDLSGK